MNVHAIRHGKASLFTMTSKIAVITHGRFHSFDLAEQIQSSGRLAAIYTGYPKFKLRNTKVDPALIRSFPWMHMPQLALIRATFLPRRWPAELGLWAGRCLAAYAALTLPECDVLTALSGGGLKAGRVIQRRGGIYVCDRGSSHIRWQNATLAKEYAELGFRWLPIDPRLIAIEETEYATADAITVPSTFAKRTFVEMGVPETKLKVIPYGVNLAAFRRSEKLADNFRVLFVGHLSIRKGLHYLLQAFRQAKLPGAELILVGGKAPETDRLLQQYPADGIEIKGILPRDGVVREMSRASVMVLPSIEEGLALVQGQALACGCPVIGTTHTGAEDLFEDGKEGYIVAPRDIGAIADRLTYLFEAPSLRAQMAEAAVERTKLMGGWDEYGRSMMRLFDDLLTAKASKRA